jgi:2-methylcitrate dehydratase PrpD
VGYKPHASVTSIHTALDGLAEIMREHSLTADGIARVETGLSPMTHVHCAWEYQAQGVTAAQMNLYYGLAVTALDGMAFTEQYQESRLRDPRILDFIKRISAHVDPEIERMGAPARHAARVKVITRDARSFEKMLFDRRGSPEYPLSRGDIEYKFRHVVAPCVSQVRAERIIQVVRTLDTLDSTRELIELFAERTLKKV